MGLIDWIRLDRGIGLDPVSGFRARWMDTSAILFACESTWFFLNNIIIIIVVVVVVVVVVSVPSFYFWNGSPDEKEVKGSFNPSAQWVSLKRKSVHWVTTSSVSNGARSSRIHHRGPHLHSLENPFPRIALVTSRPSRRTRRSKSFSQRGRLTPWPDRWLCREATRPRFDPLASIPSKKKNIYIYQLK